MDEKKVCLCGFKCWLLDTKHKLKCCPGCVGVKKGHYPNPIVKEGERVGEEAQTCGCKA